MLRTTFHAYEPFTRQCERPPACRQPELTQHIFSCACLRQLRSTIQRIETSPAPIFCFALLCLLIYRQNTHWHRNLFGRHGQSRTTLSGGTAQCVKCRTTFQTYEAFTRRCEASGLAARTYKVILKHTVLYMRRQESGPYLPFNMIIMHH